MSDRKPLNARDDKKRQSIPETKLELIEYVDQRIADATARDRDFIRYSITVTLALVGAVVTVAATILTIVGFKTFDDIKAKINETAKSTVEQEIRAIDPKQSYKNNLQELYAKSLIQLIVGGSTLVSRDDTNFLVSFLLRDGTSPELFSSALMALQKQTDDRNAVQEKLMEYLEGHKAQYNRISSDSSKIHAVIRFFAEQKYPYAMPAVRKWIADPDATSEVREATIDYAASVGDQESVLEISRIINDRQPRIAAAAIKALATIAPQSSVLATWASSTFAELKDQDAKRVHDVAAILCSKIEPAGFNADSPDGQQSRTALAKAAVTSLIGHHYSFMADRQLSTSNPDRIRFGRFLKRRDSDFDVSESFVGSTLFSTCGTLSKSILKEHFFQKHPSELIDTIRFFAVYDTASRDPWISPFVSLGNGGRILLADGNVLDNAIAGAAMFRVEGTEEGPAVMVGFLRSGGDRPWAKVAGFEDFENVTFYLGFREHNLYFGR